MQSKIVPIRFPYKAGLLQIVNDNTMDIQGRHAKHEIGLGVYNLLNRHNPFMLRYNPDTHAWNLISLLPILPSISWHVRF